MTPTEQRLTAVLAETAGTVREDTLRPLAVPAHRPRRWPRAAAPIAAAAAVAVTVLGVEIVVGQMTGPSKAAGRTTGAAPTAGNSANSMAYDAANGTIYVAVTRFSAPRASQLRHGNRPGFHAEPGSLAMISAAACNASSASGCSHVSYAPTGGRGATDVAIDEQTHTAYVLNRASKTVAVINTATCNAVTTSGCAQHPAQVRLPYIGNDLAVNPRTDTIYVAELSQPKPPLLRAEMSVINGAACNASDTSGCSAPATTVTLGTGRFLSPEITVDPGTNTLYVAVAGLAVIDGRACTGTDTHGCTKILATAGAQPDGYGPTIAVDAPAGTIYASSDSLGAGGGTVVAINRNTCNTLDTTGCAHLAAIRGGPGPGGVAADPGTHTLYVANEPNAVSMVDTAACNASSVSACPQFPASFPAGSYPKQIVVSPATHTVYVLNAQAGNLSVINSAACNATDTRGCPTKSPAGTPSETAYICDPTISAYEGGEPARPPTRTSVRVASGTAGSQAWSLWARKGVVDPYGIEQGGLVLNGRWYPLCHHGLSAGPDGDLALVDAGAHGIVYGYVQHPSTVTIRLGDHRPQWTPQSVQLPGTTFFIFQLPRSACAYHGLAVNAWQGRNWGGYSNASYGACLPNKIVSTTVGRGTWGPDYQGQHW